VSIQCSPILITERLILRHWRESDREPFARLNADPRVMEFMPHALSAQESNSRADRIEQHFRVHGFGLCAVELRRDGSFVGFIGLNVPSFDAAFTDIRTTLNVYTQRIAEDLCAANSRVVRMVLPCGGSTLLCTRGLLRGSSVTSLRSVRGGCPSSKAPASK